jgi:hypothetical protein
VKDHEDDEDHVYREGDLSLCPCPCPCLCLCHGHGHGHGQWASKDHVVCAKGGGRRSDRLGFGADEVVFDGGHWERKEAFDSTSLACRLSPCLAPTSAVATRSIVSEEERIGVAPSSLTSLVP